MKKLSRADLWSLEEYAERRPVFRAQVIAHKRNRQVPLDEHARLYFEDETTIRYQVQEMLRIEKVFEAQGIEDELEAYNPLIPDGSNWKATFMLEYDDPQERQRRLTQLIGIEGKVWVQVAGCDRVFAIADEDLERDDGTKTSTVHFLRFELSRDMIAAVHKGAAVSVGIAHPGLPIAGVELPLAVRDSLAADLQRSASH